MRIARCCWAAGLCNMHQTYWEHFGLDHSSSGTCNQLLNKYSISHYSSSLESQSYIPSTQSTISLEPQRQELLPHQLAMQSSPLSSTQVYYLSSHLRHGCQETSTSWVETRMRNGKHCLGLSNRLTKSSGLHIYSASLMGDFTWHLLSCRSISPFCSARSQSFLQT